MINKLFLFAGLLSAANVYSQQDSIPVREKIYRAYPKYEIPLGAAGMILFSTVGYPAFANNRLMTEADVAKLNPADVNWFDRPVIFNPTRGYDGAIRRSDLLLNISVLTPAILALDKKIRKDWIDLLGMYLVTHAINNTIFLSVSAPVNRVRPMVYNPELPMEERTGKTKRNSFYGGHVANAAAATFFLAKVYTDYHHIKGWRRLLFYTAAAVPPAFVGHYRLKAGRHFRSDIILGFLTGATSGIMIPELHRIKMPKNLSMSPYYSPEGTGVAFTWKLN